MKAVVLLGGLPWKLAITPIALLLAFPRMSTTPDCSVDSFSSGVGAKSSAAAAACC